MKKKKKNETTITIALVQNNFCEDNKKKLQQLHQKIAQPKKHTH